MPAIISTDESICSEVAKLNAGDSDLPSHADATTDNVKGKKGRRYQKQCNIL